LYQSSYIRSLNSTAPPPEPSMTAIERRVSRSAASGSSFASRSASSVAAMAIGTTRETWRMFFASTHCVGSKSTSPAMRQGSVPGSKWVIARMPLRPAARAEK
jgi:hypothetical protein